MFRREFIAQCAAIAFLPSKFFKHIFAITSNTNGDTRSVPQSPKTYGALGDGVTVDTKALQAAINDAALRGETLVAAQGDVFLIDNSITLPSNFHCDFHGATIVRKTGTGAAYDLWTNVDHVNGNENIEINNVTFDGKRVADALSNRIARHRFCGLRLVRCSGSIKNIRANNTVNGEIQTEGVRGGICLDRSVAMKAYKLYGDGTDGTAVLVYKGNNYIDGVWTKNNTGSGFSSYSCTDNEFHNLHSDYSGYSGVSINGHRIRASGLYAENAAHGYAGVNIGHNSPGNESHDAQVSDIHAANNKGWGIVVTASERVTGVNWTATGNAIANVNARQCNDLKIIGYRGTNATNNDCLFHGAGSILFDGSITDANYSGIYAYDDAILVISKNSLITGCGATAGITGGVVASAGASVTVYGKIINNHSYGIIANSAKIQVNKSEITNNAKGNLKAIRMGAFKLL